MNKTRFTTKALLSLLVVMVVLGSFAVVANAVDAFKNYNLAYGEIVPTDEKLEAQKFTYNLYGDKDKLYFMQLSKGKKNSFFAVEIYSDKNYQSQIRSYSKNYSTTAGNTPLTVTWEFKTLPSGTYYGRCYTYIEVEGEKSIDTSSLKTFTINVDRISKKTVELKSIANTVSGPKITWTPFSTATEYYVYRKASGDKSWTRIATLGAKSKTYTDKTAKSGTSYTYTVKCAEGKFVSRYNKTGLTIKYLATPVISVNGTGAAGNAKISWKAISGAEGYYVYRKGGSLSDYEWAKIATIKNGKTTSYTDKAAKSDDWKYTYTVKAFSGKSTSSYNSDGVDFDYIPAPTLTKVAATVNGLKIQWKCDNPNVTKYAVYRKNGSSWTNIGTTTNKSFVDKDTVSGKTYTYTVKAFSDTNAGAFNGTGITAKYLEAPKLEPVTFDSSYRAKVQWSKVPGATGYRVYRKINDASEWTHIATIKSGSTVKYNDGCKKASGYSYTYTVRAFDANNVFSSYYSAGTKGICLGKPNFTSQQIVTDDGSLCIETTWKAIKGATKYNVYRRLPGGSWTVLASGITETTYLDYTVECGITYEYAVRSFNDTGDSSTYNLQSAIAVIIPTLNSVTVTENGTALTWDAIENADLYTIYRKAKGSDTFEVLGTSETNEYVDVTEEGKTEPFYYTVSATFDETESQYRDGMANFVEIKVNAEYVPATDGNYAYVKVDFECPDATALEVYKSVNDGEPVLLEAISGSFTDIEIDEGTTYTYTVVAVGEGKIANTESASARFPYPPLAEVVISDYVKDFNNNQPYATITWGSVEFADEYVILRKYQNETEWTEIATVTAEEGLTAYSYTDTDILTDVYYNYAVKAVSKDAERGTSTSELVEIYIPAPLSAVTGLKIENPEKTDDGKVQVRVSWEITEFAESYVLYRKAGNGEFEYIWTYDAGTTLAYTDTIEANIPYTYRVEANATDRDTVSNEEVFVFVDESVEYVALKNAELFAENSNVIVTDLLNCDDVAGIIEAVNGAEIEITKDENGYYGTGAEIKVTKYGTVLETYYLVVKSDVNGDGVCDVLDYQEIELVINSLSELNQLQTIAGDLNNDGTINETDYELFAELLNNN
ncbi:MAG: hypothetical protein IKT55_00370 [Clostridia bacterium]|nr:hypothetical protein [Clostridia bacterium]